MRALASATARTCQGGISTYKPRKFVINSPFERFEGDEVATTRSLWLMLERRAATAVAAGAVVAALWYLQSRRIRVNWQRVLRKRKHTFDQERTCRHPRHPLRRTRRTHRPTARAAPY